MNEAMKRILLGEDAKVPQEPAINVDIFESPTRRSIETGKTQELMQVFDSEGPSIKNNLLTNCCKQKGKTLCEIDYIKEQLRGQCRQH